MGDYVSGGTVYRLTDKTDGGDILRQELVWIQPGWSYHDLWAAIFPVGVRLLVETVRDLENGTVQGTEQDERCATLGARRGIGPGWSGRSCWPWAAAPPVSDSDTNSPGMHGLHPGLCLVHLQHRGPGDLS